MVFTPFKKCRNGKTGIRRLKCNSFQDTVSYINPHESDKVLISNPKQVLILSPQFSPSNISYQIPNVHY